MKKHTVTSIVLFLLKVISVEGQIFHNLGFDQKCDTSKTGLCYWDLSWGAKGAVSPLLINHQNCLLIRGKNETAVGFVEQSALVPSPGQTKIITVTARIKTDSVEGRGAGLNLGLYDKEGNLLASKDMGGFYSLDWIRGTTAWKEFSISMVCPQETGKIKIGMILYGKGKACYQNYKVTMIPLAGRKPGKLAEEYISAVCDTIQRHSLVRDSIDIHSLRKTALQIAGSAKTYNDCYLAVTYLLESLRPFGDEHSFLMTVAELKNWKKEGSQVSKIQYPAYKIVDSCGYITVPAFHGGNPTHMLAYADSMQAALQRLYHLGIKGWVVDLRENTGGNMAPMIAGLGPLFSSEKLGSLVDVNGKWSAWHYVNGHYFWDQDTGWKVAHPIKLTSRLPIAVLTSPQTGSSGEAVVVSFIGNEQTKSFGQPTWGLTTGNGSFDLKDGSQIFLASTIMADRNNRQYHARITPDEVVDDKEKDLAVKRAIQWIFSQQKRSISGSDD